MRRGIVLATLVLLGIAIARSDRQIAASQDAFTGPGRYRIEIVATGKALDLKMEDKKTLQQWAGSGGRNQQWEVEDAGNGYFVIKSVETGNVLDCAEKKARDGSGVIVAGRGNSEQQLWKIAPSETNSGQFTIISKAGKALEAPAGKRDDGTRLQLWGPHGLENQRFRFIRLADLEPKIRPREPSPTTPIGAGAGVSVTNNSGFLGKGRYRIQSVLSGYFLDLKREDNQSLQQWSGSGAANQQWDAEDAGGGYFYLRCVETGKVLEASGSKDGSLVLVKSGQPGRDTQKWRVVDLGNGQALIVAKSGKVLDVKDSARTEGTRIQVWGEHRADNQRFRFDRLDLTNQYSGGRTRDEGRLSRPGRGNASEEEPYVAGRLRWRGRVDQEILLEVQGSSVREQLVAGKSFNNGRFTFSAAMPRRALEVRVENKKVRGTVEIVERPTAANNFMTLLRIRDPQNDAADYEFELIW